jgi:hypothetical protein
MVPEGTESESVRFKASEGDPGRKPDPLVP